MRRLALLILVGLAGCAQERGFDGPRAVNDVGGLGPWEIQHSPEGGISVQMPCKATALTSDGQDGYGHATKYYELRCAKDVGGAGMAFFRVSRTTYPASRDLARQNFQRYLDYVRSPPRTGPTVRLAGTRGSRDVDYVLKQRSVRGDLGFTESQDGCGWNFMGLDGGSEVQAVMMLPSPMCPVADQSISTGIASKFFDSILYDAW